MIPRLRTTVAGLLVVLSMASLFSSYAAGTEASATARRLWVETTGGSSSTNATLKTTFSEEYALPATVLWAGELESKESYDHVTAGLTIFSASGDPLHEGSVEIQVTEGVTPFSLSWTPEGLGEGDYRGELTVERQRGDLLAAESYRIRLISRGQLDTRLAETARKLEEIRGHLDNVLAGKRIPPYSAMRLAVVEEYLPAARQAVDSGDWRRAEGDLSFLAGLLVAVRSELSFAGDPERMTDSAAPPVKSPRIEKGGFVSGGRPVFLLGVVDEASVLTPELPAMRRYGLNLAVTKLSPARTRPSREASPAISGDLMHLLDEAEALRMGVTVRLTPESLPPWMAETYPAIVQRQTGSFPYDVRHPQAQRLLDEHLRCVLNGIQGRTCVVSAALAERPELQFTGEDVRQGLIAFAKAAYPDHVTMNRAWETLYLDFDEIQIRWDFARLAYRHDLEVYQQGLGTAFFKRLADTARAASARVPLQIDYTDRVFDTGESALGIDREVLSALTDVSGCVAAQDTVHPYLALGYPSQSLYYTLLRSFSPGAPVFNVEDGFTLEPHAPVEMLRHAAHTLVWEGAMSGLSASAVPMGTRDGSRATLLGTPERLEGYASACLDLNRLAPIVRAFQENPAGISILWSMSSKIYSNGDPFLESVRRAYEGCHTFGYPVSFVTEAGLARGALDAVKVLVIPDTPSLADEAYQAIDEYIGNGGVVVRMGKPISYTPGGASRQGALATSTRAVLIRGTDLPTDYLHALDAACTLEGVEQVPRAINGSGYPLEGVKTRFAVVDDVPYLYVVNLRKTAVSVHLMGPYQEGRDLIEERSVRFPATLQPLDPMLVRLEVLPEEEQPAGELVASEGTPTGVIQPIQKEAAEVAKSPAPRKRQGTRYQ